MVDNSIYIDEYSYEKKIHLVLFKDQINKIRGTDAIKLRMNVCINHFVG